MSQYSGGTFISSVTPVVHDGGEPGQVDMKLGFHAKQPASLQSEQRTHVETTQSDPSLFRQQEQVNGTIKACWLRRNCSFLQREEEPHRRKHPHPCYELTQDQAFQLCKKKKRKVEDKEKKKKKKIKHASKRECQKQKSWCQGLQNLAGHQENSNVTAEMNQRCTEEKTDWDSVKENGEWRGLGAGSLVLAAGELAAPLAVCGWGEAYVHYIVPRRLIVSRSVRYLLLGDNAVDFCKR